MMPSSETLGPPGQKGGTDSHVNNCMIRKLRSKILTVHLKRVKRTKYALCVCVTDL